MILLLLATCTFLYIINFYWKVSKYPKGPLPLPIIGNLHQMNIKTIHLDLKAFADKYGEIYTFWMMGRPVIILSTYSAVKEALITKGEFLVDRPHNAENDIFQHVENGGLVFSNGESWREHRRATLHILRDFGVGKNRMDEMIREQAAAVISHIEATVDKDAVDIFPFTVNMVANIINQFLFGYAYPFDKSERLMKLINDMNQIPQKSADSFIPQAAIAFPILTKLPYFGYRAIGMFKEAMNAMTLTIDEDIKRCLTDYSVSDEPTCLVQAYHREAGKNEHFNNFMLQNLITDMFFAGTETTTNTLRWIMTYVTAYPEVQERMRQEIASVVGFEKLPSLSDKNVMPYCQAAILEVQRHSNMFSLFLNRRTTKDVILCGQPIPEGTSVIPQMYSCHLDEQIFKKPDVFMPERFLTADLKTIDQDMANKMTIFGMGKRVCAGEGLARAELFIFSTSLIQKYHFTPQNEKNFDIIPGHAIVMPPKRQLFRLQNVDTSKYVK